MPHPRGDRPARRLLPVLLLAAFAVPEASFWPASASAGTVTGTFSVAWAGAAAAPGSTPEPAASAAWSFDFHTPMPGNGDFPALLTAVSQSSTTACDPDFGLGSIITSITAIEDPTGSVNVVSFLDLRRRRGRVTLRPSRYDNGTAHRTVVQACEAPLDEGNGSSSSSVPVESLFGTVSTPDDWPLRQARDGSWRGSGTQTVSPGNAPAGFAPQVQTMQITLRGSATSLNALCRMPTPRDLRHIRTLRAAKAYLASAGFPRPRVFVLPSNQVRAGHYFIRQQATDDYRGCGAGIVTLVLSSGRPTGGSGGAEDRAVVGRRG